MAAARGRPQSRGGLPNADMATQPSFVALEGAGTAASPFLVPKFSSVLLPRGSHARGERCWVAGDSVTVHLVDGGGTLTNSLVTGLNSLVVGDKNSVHALRTYVVGRGNTVRDGRFLLACRKASEMNVHVFGWESEAVEKGEWVNMSNWADIDGMPAAPRVVVVFGFMDSVHELNPTETVQTLADEELRWSSRVKIRTPLPPPRERTPDPPSFDSLSESDGDEG
jgi:hypothetical protein